MRPLAAITRAAERVSAQDLHRRIDPERWPRELAALATAFDQMLARLEDSFTRLSQFSADLAHELRGPINNLMGEAEVALSRARSEAEYRDVLESSLEEYGRLSRMIDGLLFLARAEAAERRIAKTRLDARREVEAVIEFHDALADEGGVKVSCDGSATVSADPGMFRRAVSNLLSNALQHTPPGGAITITLSAAPGGGAEVRVADTGVGIAAEHLPRLFDRFYRADPARAHSRGGIGLGLAIVKSIMEVHGGRVTITSRPGAGTTVILAFPS
jgi:two-component system heavy metal sensor histidine kinase CusS